jgi:hypothetical protein
MYNPRMDNKPDKPSDAFPPLLPMRERAGTGRTIKWSIVEVDPSDDITVTPEMIDAGYRAIMFFDREFDDPKEYATNVYQVMAEIALKQGLIKLP